MYATQKLLQFFPIFYSESDSPHQTKTKKKGKNRNQIIVLCGVINKKSPH